MWLKIVWAVFQFISLRNDIGFLSVSPRVGGLSGWDDPSFHFAFQDADGNPLSFSTKEKISQRA